MDHAWLIEEREIRRQEARRGTRHAWERLDPGRTALVVVDVVPFFFEENQYIRGIVPRINRIATALREWGGTVAWVVPARPAWRAVDDEFVGAQVAEMMRGSGGEGTPLEKLWPELDARTDDLFAEKTGYSAFFPGASVLHDLLQERGVENIVVTGTVTNVCVESTVRDANALGYRVVLVADACAAMRDQDHNATLHVVYRTFGDVRPTEEVLGLFRPVRAGAGAALESRP